jgi:hypothetical protein
MEGSPFRLSRFYDVSFPVVSDTYSFRLSGFGEVNDAVREKERKKKTLFTLEEPAKTRNA